MKKAEIFKAFREEMGWSQSQMAQAMGLDRTYISNLEREINPITDKVWRRFEGLQMHRSAAVLKEGTGDIYQVSKPAVRPVELSTMKITKIPVISWASAGTGGDYCDLEEVIDEYLWSDIKDPNSYALIIDGDSMEPRYFEGDRIVVAPNSEARNGDDVVARVQETGEVLFKKFHRSANIVKLTSYNRVYPELEFRISDFRFIHPVWSVVRKVRR